MATLSLPASLQRLPSQVFSSDESSVPTSPDSITHPPSETTAPSSSTDTPPTSAGRSTTEPESYFLINDDGPNADDATPPPFSRPRRTPTTASAPPEIESSARNRHRRQLSSPSNRAPIKTSSHGRLTETSLDGPDLEGGHRRLNEYTLVRTLGKGSFGVVELGRHDDGREFAIKEYSKARMRKRAWTTGSLRARRGPRPRVNGVQNDGLELVKAEIAILKKCAHPNICSLTEVIDTDGDSVFYVMDLCKGGPVMEVTVGERSEPLPLEDARNIMQQIILGVEYLHCNEIIHRDIKPDNILFVEEGKSRGQGHIRIVDFGTSEHFSKAGDDTMHSAAGSPAFLAPELCITPDGAHGKAADIWACGVTLYALVTGQVPFDNPHPLALSEAICNDPVHIPKELPEDLKHLLCRMLHKSPDARITMPELREHPWITKRGEDPLPTTAENVSPFAAPSEEEIARAVAPFRSTATVLRAVRKFKRQSSGSSGDSDVRAFGALRLEGGKTVTSPTHSPRPLPTSPRIPEEMEPTSPVEVVNDPLEITDDSVEMVSESP